MTNNEAPQRIQRQQGEGLPPGAIYVGHSTKWGNPYLGGRAEAVAAFELAMKSRPDLTAMARRELGGRDLACWCRLDESCHADVLLEVANR